MFTPFAFVKTAPAAGGPTLWTPANITTLVWYDASNQSSITLNGSTVSQINDLSGNGYNGIQSNSAKQPTYADTLNGLKVLTYDGNNKGLPVSPVSYPSNYQMSYYFVGQLLGRYGNYDTGLTLFKGGSDGVGLYVSMPTYGWGCHTYTAFYAGTVLDSNPVFLGMVCDQSSSPYITFSTNGNLSYQTASNPFTGASVFTSNDNGIGNDQYNSVFQGYWGEAIVVPQKDNTAARQKMEGYLAWKWGLQANLPNDSPYKNSPPYV